MPVDVGLEALLKPKVDQKAAKKEVRDLEDLLSDAESLDVDADLSGVEKAVKRVQRDLTGEGGGGGGLGDQIAQEASEQLSGALGGAASGKMGSKIAGAAGGAASKAAGRLGIGGGGAAAGGAAAGGGALSAAASVAIPVALTGAVAYGMMKGIQKMAGFAPQGRKMLDMFGTAMELAFRPLGRLIGNILMPYAEGALKAMAKMNRMMAEDGLIVGGMKFLHELLKDLPGGLADAIGDSWDAFVEGLGLDKLGKLTWDDFVSVLAWASFLNPMTWASWLVMLVWGDWIEDLLWSVFIEEPLKWGAWILKKLKWTSWIGSVLEWAIWIEEVLGWDTFVDSLTWSNWLGSPGDFDWADWLGGFDDWLSSLSLPDWLTSNFESNDDPPQEPRNPKYNCPAGQHYDPVMRACVPDVPYDPPPSEDEDPYNVDDDSVYDDDIEDRGHGDDGSGSDDSTDTDYSQPISGHTGPGDWGTFTGMARGGIVTKATRIMAGERGREAIIPLEDYDLGIPERGSAPKPEVTVEVEQPEARTQTANVDQNNRDMRDVKDRLDRVLRAIEDLDLDVSLEIDGEKLAETSREARDRYIDERDVVR